MELIEPLWLATQEWVPNEEPKRVGKKTVTERNLGNAGPKASFAPVDFPLGNPLNPPDRELRPTIGFLTGLHPKAISLLSVVWDCYRSRETRNFSRCSG